MALLIFIAAVLTDIWDGRIARRRQLITDFGKLMDPIADKILISAAFISFINQPELSSRVGSRGNHRSRVSREWTHARGRFLSPHGRVVKRGILLRQTEGGDTKRSCNTLALLALIGYYYLLESGRNDAAARLLVLPNRPCFASFCFQ